MLKTLLTIFALVSVAACGKTNATSPVISYPGLYNQQQLTAPINPKSIRLLSCSKGSGTAFQYDKDLFITAHHVLAAENCVDAETGITFKTVLDDQKNDFAIIRASHSIPDSTPLKISCQPFKAKKTYYSVGWAGGVRLMSTPVVAKGYAEPFETSQGTWHVHLRHLLGFLIPGMSGGPIVEQKSGVVHGINNATDMSIPEGFSRELKDTKLCK